MIIRRNKIFLIFLAVLISVFSVNIYAQLNPVSAQYNTGEKPQSKVWYYGGYWWTVIPVSSGTYIYRLDVNTWTQQLKLDNNTDLKADTKADGDITHILLFEKDTETAKLVSVQFVAGSPPTYELWTVQPDLVNIPLDKGTETAVIDLDSKGRMWLGSAGTTQIYVRWSDSPYTSWYNGTINTDRYQLNSADVKDDDICDITAFGGDKIGVLWSNQNDDKFHFRYHSDSDNPTTWSTDKIASPGVTGSFSDDHINFAVSSDGTIYAAVKTSYDSGSEPTIALLERHTNGVWNVYDVTNNYATRPIALLDDTNHKIFVVYTSTSNNNTGGVGDIKYNWSYTNTSSISFEGVSTLAAGSYNNATSTKETFNNQVVILYSTSDNKWNGIIPDGVFPVELASFNGLLNGNNVELRWRTETEVNNYGFEIERSIDRTIWGNIGFVPGHGNSNSPNDYEFTDRDKFIPAGTIYYRLKQEDIDGKFEYSNAIKLEYKVQSKPNLSQNYPNPFNPTSVIEYTLPADEFVSLKVYDILGREVAALVNEKQNAGKHSVNFNGSSLASGVYFYILTTNNFVLSKKMNLIK